MDDRLDPSPRLGFVAILARASWIGLGAGTSELVIFMLKCWWLDPRNLNVSRQFVWMMPAAGLLVVGGVGLVVGLVSRIVPRLSRPEVIAGLLMTIGLVGVLFRAPIYTLACLALAGGLGWKAAPWTARRLCWLDHRPALALVTPWCLLAVVATVSMGRESWEGWSSSPDHWDASTTSTKPNVILIVLDTVRADHLSTFGYPRNTSPRLTQLAERGVRFTRAFSTAPWTGPSHASMFTGRWPHELSIGWDRPLDTTYPTLAEVLAARGYATAGFVANTTYGSYETGLDRGFLHYEDYDVTWRGLLLESSLVERSWNFVHKHPNLSRWLGEATSTGDRKDAARINRDFLRWVDARETPNQPFFAFLNFYDAHHPYLAPEPDTATQFGRKPQTPRDFRLLKTWWERDKSGISEADLTLAIGAYDRCIASLDDQLGKLFDQLDQRGLLDRSVVVVTSDHGEHLGEHTLYGHGCSLYQAELHVPLVIAAPGLGSFANGVDAPVSLRDLPATILDQIGDRKPSPFPGRSLARPQGPPPLEGLMVRSELAKPPDDDPNGGRSPASKGPMLSLVDGDLHYIRRGDGSEEVYDLRLDPAETRDLTTQPGSAVLLQRFRDEARR